MMGTKARLFTPVSAVSLDALVRADHFYRHLDRVLDLSFVRDLVQECYVADKGRPSVDPVVFFRLQLVMFFEGIRSERQLLRLAADRLSVRWYLGYNLDEPLPDHSSLTHIRTRYGLQVFHRFFDAVVAQCQEAGFVWGRELYFDATQVQAHAALDSLTARFAVETRAARQVEQTGEEAVKAHLAALFTDGPPTSTQQTNEVAAPAAEGTRPPSPPVLSLTDHTGSSLASLSANVSESQWEDLAAANAARHDWIVEAGRQRREAHGLYQRTADLRISATDADATPMRLKGGGTHLGYQTHYVVDGGRRRIIVGVLVTPGEVMENQPMLDLLWRARFRWRLRPRQVTGDTKYGTLENIQAVEDMGIRAYLPLPDWEHQRPYFGPGKFTFDAQRDVYICPQGQVLRPFRREYQAQKTEYRAEPATCNACALKGECTPSNHGRQVHRHFAESYLDRVRAYHQTPAYEKAMRKRKVWVEPLFAEAKEWHGLRRFRLRRLWRVNCEALLIAAGQNLKRLLQRRGWGRRPLPSGAALGARQSESTLMCLVVLVILAGPRHYLDRRAHVCRWAELAA
jgi:transposase